MAESVDHEGQDVDTTYKPTDTNVPEAEPSDIPINGGSSHQKSSNGSVDDPDAQQMVIMSLRGQIQELVNQVTQLNTKLVKSYDRVSDLEDELHVASSQLRSSSIKVSQLELERSQHLSALSTGLLVEKYHVTSELNRLMEKATEEAAQRGQAESARVAIEKELADLSANLFNQANTMVAEARYGRHLSERKTEEAETALKSAEEAVCLMQQKMQSLREEKELAQKKAQEMQLSVGKGKRVETQQNGTHITRALRLLSSHTPYQEFVLFIAHLRSIHMSTPHPPSMSTLLTLPLLQRLSTEDSDPTVRMDQAHSLNWLSRRSVLTAIYSGQLIVEPLSLYTLVGETIAGLSSNGNEVPCALCGSPIFSKDEIMNHVRTHSISRSSGGSNSWSSSIFKKSPSNPYSGSAPSTPRRSLSLDLPQVYIFRVAVSQIPSITISALPVQSSPSSPYTNTTSSNSQSSTIYPLCRGGWCLYRLRTTCQLWSFVRNGIVEKVWEEELPAVLAPPPRIPVSTETSKPPALPPRRKGFWGMASALGEKAATWSEAAKKMAPSAQPDQQYPLPLKQPSLSQEMDTNASKEKPELPTKLPPPPPTHPAVSAAYLSAPSCTTNLPVAAGTGDAGVDSMLPPPPVPRRSEGRSRAKSPSLHPPEPGPTSQVPSETSGIASSASETSTQTSPSSPSAPAITTSSPTSSYHNSPPPIPLRAIGHKRHSSALPERIPLPDSRPATPTPVVNGGPPSRPSSPALGANSTGGAVPPPIPRRAAARGASRLASNMTNEPISRPSTPSVHTMHAANSESESAERKEEAVQNKARETTGPSEVEEVPGKNVDCPPSDVAPVPEMENSSGSALKENGIEGAVNDKGEETEIVNPGTDMQIQTDASTEVMPAPIVKVAGPNGEEQNDDVNTNGYITSNHGEEDSSDASNRTLYGSSKAASPSPLSSNGTDLGSRHASSDPEQQRPEEKGEDSGIYVGDATWEERTWKELVRLREDMFWARIGGLR